MIFGIFRFSGRRGTRCVASLPCVASALVTPRSHIPLCGMIGAPALPRERLSLRLFCSLYRTRDRASISASEQPHCVPQGAKFCSECGARHQPLSPQHAVNPSRKVATVLFADLKGSTQAISAIDAEAAMLRIRPLIIAMATAVREHGGTVIEVRGTVFFQALAHWIVLTTTRWPPAALHLPSDSPPRATHQRTSPSALASTAARSLSHPVRPATL